jgi:NitT/TauT family transport system substrate-binding protein
MQLPARWNRALPALALALCAAAFSPGAAAQAKVRVGALKTMAMVPLYYAEREGYFKKEGLDVEFIALSSGPAVASALSGGSFEIGQTNVVPTIFARSSGQPFKIFGALTYETVEPNGQITWLVASERSGVKTAKDLAGKTVALNASGAFCEMMTREHLAKAGVPYDAVKKLIVPFPQMQAALELGNADAACTIEPFRTAMETSPKVKASAVGFGGLPNLAASQRVMMDVLMVRDDWAEKNADTMARFSRAVNRALQDMRQQPQLFRQWMVEDFRIDAPTASAMKVGAPFTDLRVRPQDIAPMIEALQRHGMLKAPVKPGDIVVEVK